MSDSQNEADRLLHEAYGSMFDGEAREKVRAYIYGYTRAPIPASAQGAVKAGLQEAIDSIPPDLNWLIGKGKTRHDEPPFGVQLLRGLKIVAETEGDDLCDVIKAAIAAVEMPK